ncbi:hypothetical protein [Bacillus rhizoplanae]|uniref:hypothetical protein n=1 Tax=Bacillus rhizoplanae TaxID=2880966 RepID=UPI003D1F6EFD
MDVHLYRLWRKPSPQPVFMSELLLSVNTDKQDEKKSCPMMGALKNHGDKRVIISVEDLILQDHFLHAIESTIDFHFIEEKLVK